MPTFEIASPDGKKYRVTAPEGTSQQEIFEKVQGQIGGGGQSKLAKQMESEKTGDIPRWDFGGDVGRAFTESKDALKNSIDAALPFSKDKAVEPPNPVSSFVNAVKTPFNALSVISSPATGLARTAIGSPLSYALEGIGVQNPVRKAQEGVDLGMMALAPKEAAGIGEVFEGNRNELAAFKPVMNQVKDINYARDKLSKAVDQNANSGGASREDIIAQLNAAKEAGRPLSLMDIGGEHVKAIAQNLIKTPGEASNQILSFLKNRAPESNARLGEAVADNISAEPSAKQAIKQFATDRSTKSAPLYEESLAPGSTGPLEDTLTKHFQDSSANLSKAEAAVAAAERRATQAAAQKSRAGDNVYATNTALGEEKVTGETLESSKKALEDAKVNHEEIKSFMQAAQEANEKGIRGGIYSPKLARLMDLSDPDIRAGVNKGIYLLKKEAALKGERFNDRDYAITGYDANNDPIVSKVPNMKLIQAVKEGLSAALDENNPEIVDPKTGRYTKKGSLISQQLKGIVSEVDTLNPKWAEARKEWSGPSQTINSVHWGENLMDRSLSPEDVGEWVAKKKADAPGDIDAAKIGLAEKMRDMIRNGGIDAKALKEFARDNTKSTANKEKVKMLFDKDEDFFKFIDAFSDEKAMADTNKRLLSVEKTAAKVEEEGGLPENAKKSLELASILHNIHSGFLGTALHKFARAGGGYLPGPSKFAQQEIVNSLLDPNLTSLMSATPGENFLRSIPLPQTQHYLAKGASMNALLARQALQGPNQQQ